MARKKSDRVAQAEDSIYNRLSNINKSIVGESDVIVDISNDVMERVNSSSYDEEKIREDIRQLKGLLIEFAQTSLDEAEVTARILEDSTMRNLEGKEAVGYSKRDMGATYDMLYGQRALNRQVSRSVYWPLKLDEWDSEIANRSGMPPDVEPVAATGTKKFTKEVGGLTVHVVIDAREREPPI